MSPRSAISVAGWMLSPQKARPHPRRTCFTPAPFIINNCAHNTTQFRSGRPNEEARMSEAGRLYFATGVDIDPAAEDEFNEWYDTDHLPSVVACPGFLWGCRYRIDHRDSPRYWVVYEVESREA